MNEIKFPKFKNYNDQKIRYVQPKYDGHLCKVIKLDNHLWQAYTKNHKVITDKLIGISHIEKELAGLPCNSTIFGELHCSGVPATSVPTMLNDADLRLQLTVFAAPLFDGINNTSIGKVSGDCYTEIMNNLSNCGINIVETIKIIPTRSVPKAEQEKMLQAAMGSGLEGWVLKESHMTGWYKLKPTKTLDAFVIATHQSFSSTHYGGVQALSIGGFDKRENLSLLHI